ncbi:hypothetical protein [Stygiolobus azoricus]|nr:hypothetical protein [Stygiolobus azoricus]
MEKRTKKFNELRERSILSLLSTVHDCVPIGDESASKPIRAWGL